MLFPIHFCSLTFPDSLTFPWRQLKAGRLSKNLLHLSERSRVAGVEKPFFG